MGNFKINRYCVQFFTVISYDVGESNHVLYSAIHLMTTVYSIDFFCPIRIPKGYCLQFVDLIRKASKHILS